jgi:hypothetical protein
VVHGWTVDQETAHMHNGQGGKWKKWGECC